MAKYLLLKHYRGAPASVNNVPMDQWAPDEVEAHIRFMNDFAARGLVRRGLSVLVRRGAEFATAEGAVQEALIRAFSAWKDELPSDPGGWLITVAWRAFLDMSRSDAARRDREVRFDNEPRL